MKKGSALTWIVGAGVLLFVIAEFNPFGLGNAFGNIGNPKATD